MHSATRTSHTRPRYALAAVVSLVLASLLASPAVALAYTPVRPLSRLKAQDPVEIIARAPEAAQVTLPVRYYRGQAAEIGDLASITNALTLGQLLLQKQLREVTAAYTVATNDLAAAIRDRDWYHAEYDRQAAAAAAAEARAARLDALRAWLVECRDAATLPTTKALYQAIIDRIDEASAITQ